jgi:hypothetical protein
MKRAEAREASIHAARTEPYPCVPASRSIAARRRLGGARKRRNMASSPELAVSRWDERRDLLWWLFEGVGAGRR